MIHLLLSVTAALVPAAVVGASTQATPETTASFIGMNDQATRRRRLHSTQHRQRKLQGDGSCSLFAVVSGLCTFDDFCYNPDIEQDGIQINCIGDASNEWRYSETFPERCYADSTDEEGFESPVSLSDLPGGTVCSIAHITYKLSGSTVIAVESQELVTYPDHLVGFYGGTFAVEPCSTDINWFFNKGYCEYGCPLGYQIKSQPCFTEFRCAICGDIGLINCGNIDASLVETCATGSPSIFELTAAFYGAQTVAPTNKPTQAPTPTPEPSTTTLAPTATLSSEPTGSPVVTPVPVAPVPVASSPVLSPVVAPVQNPAIQSANTPDDGVAGIQGTSAAAPIVRSVVCVVVALVVAGI